MHIAISFTNLNSVKELMSVPGTKPTLCESVTRNQRQFIEELWKDAGENHDIFVTLVKRKLKEITKIKAGTKNKEYFAEFLKKVKHSLSELCREKDKTILLGTYLCVLHNNYVLIP